MRITAKASDDAAAEAILSAEEARLRALLGDYVFGVDEQTMESVVLDMLRGRGLSLAVAESVTGGLVGARLTGDRWAPATCCAAALVAYASDIKFALLGVPEGPVVTAQAAAAMAAGVRRLLSADVGLATTGVAGPAEQEGQPVGTVFLGLALGERIESTVVRLPGDRNRIRQYGVISLLNFLRLSLLADAARLKRSVSPAELSSSWSSARSSSWFSSSRRCSSAGSTSRRARCRAAAARPRAPAAARSAGRARPDRRRAARAAPAACAPARIRRSFSARWRSRRRALLGVELGHLAGQALVLGLERRDPLLAGVGLGLERRGVLLVGAADDVGDAREEARLARDRGSGRRPPSSSRPSDREATERGRDHASPHETTGASTASGIEPIAEASVSSCACSASRLLASSSRRASRPPTSAPCSRSPAMSLSISSTLPELSLIRSCSASMSPSIDRDLLAVLRRR